MKGYNYSEDDEGNEIKTAISCFMDPAYLTQMVGIAFIPNDNFSQRVAFANRMTISHGYGYADDPDTMDAIMEAFESQADAAELVYERTADTVYIEDEDFYESLYEF